MSQFSNCDEWSSSWKDSYICDRHLWCLPFGPFWWRKRSITGETYVKWEMASNNPGFFGFIVWNRRPFWIHYFFFCNLRLCLQLIVSVEISPHRKDLTLEQWEDRSLSGQIFFKFAFLKETYIITILVYLPISVQGAWTEMLSRRW